MSRWRLLLHALDRTGPPMLARSFLRWATAHRSDDGFDVVAFRGGEMLDSFVELAPVLVVLDPREAWDAHDPPSDRLAALRRRCSTLPPVDATLLVSVASAQALPILRDAGPTVVWSVEQGEDLHWLDEPVGLLSRDRSWLAGSDGTMRELAYRLPPCTTITRCDEFIELPPAMSEQLISNCRHALGGAEDRVLVLGAGIGTPRKGVDIFLEVALAARRRHLDHLRFTWLGGEQDPFLWRVRSEADRLGLDTLRWFGNVTDVDRWLAAGDVLLQAARLDSFPLICLHAASVGTPVISFAGVGGTEEMFGDAFVGRRYPDVQGIVDLLEELSDPQERHRRGAAQRHAVTSRFISDVAAPKVMEAMESAARLSSGTVGATG